MTDIFSEDSVEQILKYEDPQLFVSCIRNNIEHYYTGPDLRQAGMFDSVEKLHPDEVWHTK